MDLGGVAGFTFEPPDPFLMERTVRPISLNISGPVLSPPIKHADFADLRMLGRILMSGFFMFWAVFSVYLVGVSIADQKLADSTWDDTYAKQHTHTMVWVAWLIAHVLLANSLRSLDRSLLVVVRLNHFCSRRQEQKTSSGVYENPVILAWTILAIIFLFVTVFTPGLQTLLSLMPLLGSGWPFALLLPCGSMLAHELTKVAAAKWLFNRQIWDFR